MEPEQMEKEINELKTRMSRLEQEFLELKQAGAVQGDLAASEEQSGRDHPAGSGIKKKRNTIKWNGERGVVSEAFIGKYALPVAASVLIMVGICVMAYMVWEVVPDLLKCFFVFLLASVCFGIGRLFGKDEKMRVFRNAMAAISLSILYADMLLAQWAWKLVPETATISLFFLWCLAGVLLSRIYEDKLFYWITSAGIAITAWIIGQSIGADARGLILACMILAAFWINCWLFVKQFGEGCVVFGISSAFVFCPLICYAAGVAFQNGFSKAIQVLAVLSIFCFAFFKDRILYMGGETKRDVPVLVVLAILALFDPAVLAEADMGAGHICIEALAVIVFGLLFLKGRRNRQLLSFFIYPSLFCSFLNVGGHDMAAGIGLAALLAVLFIFAKWTKELSFTIQYMATNIYGVFMLFVLYALSSFMDPKNIAVSGILVVAVNISFLVYSCVKLDSYKDLVCNLGCLLCDMYFLGLFIAKQRKGDAAVIVTAALVFLTFSFVSVTARVRYTDRNHRFINIYSILLSCSLLGVYSAQGDAFKASILAVLVIFQVLLTLYLLDVVNGGSLWKDIGCSFFITVNLVVLGSKTPVWDYGVLLSLSMILTAAVFIVIGFGARRKGMRLYGLIAIIISIIKMIVVDISESNSIIRVAAFIAGGVVCLGISFIYNRLEKELEKEEKPEVDERNSV